MTDASIADFTFRTRSVRVVFGPGASNRLAGALELLEARNALLITTPGRADDLADRIRMMGSVLADVFDGAKPHAPTEAVAAAVEAARQRGADSLVAVGGGSAIGVAKATALETGLPIIAVPTTYSGSEMTNVWGVRDGAGKRTGRDDRVAPRVVMYDPLLTMTFPPMESAASGMNALAHCVEALYAADRSPVGSLFAAEGVRVLARALPRIVARPDDREARSRALYGAYLAGTALDAASMGLHHKLCHVLGGMYDVPHALTHAILLPHVTEYNARFAPEAMAELARAFDGNPVQGLLELRRTLGIRQTLQGLGLGREELDAAAKAATVRPYPNPGPVTVEAVRAVLDAAWRNKSSPLDR